MCKGHKNRDRSNSLYKNIYDQKIEFRQMEILCNDNFIYGNLCSADVHNVVSAMSVCLPVYL